MRNFEEHYFYGTPPNDCFSMIFFRRLELQTVLFLRGIFWGSLLFLIYINGLPQSLSELGSYFYADDMCIFYQDKDIHKIEDVQNKELSILCEWLDFNKLPIQED